MEDPQHNEAAPDGDYFGFYDNWYGIVTGLSGIGVGIYALVTGHTAIGVGTIGWATVMALQPWIRLPFWAFVALISAAFAFIGGSAIL